MVFFQHQKILSGTQRLTRDEKILYNHLHALEVNETESRLLDFFRPWHFSHTTVPSEQTYRDRSVRYSPYHTNYSLSTDEFVLVMIELDSEC